ncbi:4-hydroxybenzoate octaprenyltransferase [Aspergillus clavatus NRRL 1]|uniref:4-hydroxybenzoate polyprenyltransferase, mitochondrial n=1 Tax=Aspergillus clavatus (strain ATCC 1007 / CBS 513.65 / DSM 816 / NCTC 3887 / NRRL 1 / QM 1276 / 107) TaxID=344612 RepID=A1CAV4_ASPCL|nr:prenyltransferase, UbiA family protein [Aspergillus clavatus NRRL 1]EAW12872.1 prenyltransferase, UbiA family protein [Aspergillus clavatus NRRL 1]
MEQVARRKRNNTADGMSKASLSKQYGGDHAEGWIGHLPPAWIPYIQLCRLSPPAAFFLIYFPHLFGILHAATTHGLPAHDVLRTSLILAGGSFFYSNACHAWNDLVDAPIDKLVARTCSRPIPRGAITPAAAFLFTCTQAVAAAAFLLLLPARTALVTIPTIVTMTYYPYAKRHTHFPQLVLGFCLTWAIMVGSSALGVPEPWTDPSAVCLLLAATLWVVIFDTIYAHQDVADDRKIGVKSTAALFGSSSRLFLGVLFLSMVGLLSGCGYYGNLGLPFYCVTVGGCVLAVGGMVFLVDLKNSASCWVWFSQGFWLAGGAISGGLLLECLLQ